jgi:hypothetical protein
LQSRTCPSSACGWSRPTSQFFLCLSFISSLLSNKSVFYLFVFLFFSSLYYSIKINESFIFWNILLQFSNSFLDSPFCLFVYFCLECTGPIIVSLLFSVYSQYSKFQVKLFHFFSFLPSQLKFSFLFVCMSKSELTFFLSIFLSVFLLFNSFCGLLNAVVICLHIR